MGRFPNVLIDCSSGKHIVLLIDGKEIPGATRIEKISKHTKDECVEITITIVANELKKKELNGEITEV